jgi:hypothetical protein
MTTIHRSPSESFPETVTWLCDLLGVDRRMATFLVWDVCTKIGTDRHRSRQSVQGVWSPGVVVGGIWGE